MDELILDILKLHLVDRISNKVEIEGDKIIVYFSNGKKANIEIKQLKSTKQDKIY